MQAVEIALVGEDAFAQKSGRVGRFPHRRDLVGAGGLEVDEQAPSLGEIGYVARLVGLRQPEHRHDALADGKLRGRLWLRGDGSGLGGGRGLRPQQGAGDHDQTGHAGHEHVLVLHG